MSAFIFEIAVFSLKALIIVLLILFLVVGLIVIISRGKSFHPHKITIKNLNEKYNEIKETLLHEIQSKKLFKKYIKEQKKAEKQQEKQVGQEKHVFVLHFHGDIKASAVTALREEVSAIVSVATPQDEVLVCIESGGGTVNGYGLAAAQLMRIRERNIPLTVSIDKIAASGGYMMACIANKIIAAPYAIVGSIGVIVQLPNFHRYLKDRHIDFEQHMAGDFKRTITIFGENTDAERKKLDKELEEIHALFKKLIVDHRPHIDIKKVATGEHWLAIQALDLQLVDKLQTSDDYMLAKSQTAKLFEIKFETKKPFGNRFFAGAQAWRDKFMSLFKFGL